MLSEEERRRIEDEEALRRELRAQHEEEKRSRRNFGRAVVGLIGFVVFMVLWLATNSSRPRRRR